MNEIICQLPDSDIRIEVFCTEEYICLSVSDSSVEWLVFDLSTFDPISFITNRSPGTTYREVVRKPENYPLDCLIRN